MEDKMKIDARGYIARGLPLGLAARAWAAGASANGAMVPQSFARYAHDGMDVADALRRAERDADWESARTVSHPDSWIRPARPVLDRGGLHWVTSVRLSLVLLDDGWAVWLSAPHDFREAAVRRVIDPPPPSDDRW